MKSIAFGPYLGDFKYEFFYFLPHIRWAKEVLNPEHVYVSSHFNREFLYKDLATKFYAINPMLSIDEHAQKNHFNKNIYKTRYNYIEKNFKDNIDGDITFYNFEYSRFKVPCSLYQLQFEKLKYDLKYRLENKILFIPDKVEKISYINELYVYLKNILGDRLVVIGDSKTHLEQENELFYRVNYHSIVYEEMINYISSCKAVITPNSIWTGISNLQEKPVISWGHFVSEYKNGKYYFNNEKGKFYPRLELNNLKKCINLFLEEL